MSLITDIKEQLNELITFKHISSAFTEAAAVKLASIRRAFIRNDRFYDEIAHIYHLVEANAQKSEMENLGKSKQLPKKLAVALTSNQRFFGQLNSEIMSKFLDFSKKNQAQRLVIGQIGESYLRAINFKEPYQTLNFSADIPNAEERRVFLAKIKDYQQITILYPKFLSIIRQEIGTADIAGKLQSGDKYRPDLAKEEIKLIFEPALSKIAGFFESEVKMILFNRVLLETELARTAARLLELSQAEERTDYEISTKKSELRKVTRSITNRELLETFSGIKKWKHSISTKRTLAEMKNKVFFLDYPVQDI